MSSRRGGLGWHPRALGHRPRLRFALASALLAVVLSALAYVQVTRDAESALREWVSNWLTVALALAMLATSAWAAGRATGRIRLAWSLMAAAGAFWSVGEILWLVENYVWHTELAPTYSDFWYLLALLPAAAALTVFPPPVREASDRLRILLTGLVVGGSVLFVSRALAFSVILPAATGTRFAQAVFLAYPTADVVLATLALVVLLRVQRQARGHLVLLAVGILLYTLSDTAYVREAALDNYAAGSLLDWGWAAGYGVFALAPLVPHATADPDAAPRSISSSRFDWSSLALYLPLLLAIVVATSAPTLLPDPFLIATGVSTLLVFAVR